MQTHAPCASGGAIPLLAAGESSDVCQPQRGAEAPTPARPTDPARNRPGGLVQVASAGLWNAMEAAAAGQDAGSKGATIHPVFRGLGAVTCSACKAHLLKAYVQQPLLGPELRAGAAA